jgi:hypothetical protein
VLSVVKRREDIIDWLVDFKVLAKNFIQKNILLVRDLAPTLVACESKSDNIVLFTQPLQDVYETIRYEKRAFTIMDARYKICDSLRRRILLTRHHVDGRACCWANIGRSMLTWSPCSAWSTNTSARYTVHDSLVSPLEVVATHCSLCLSSAPPTHQPGAIGGNHDGRSQQRHLGHHVRARGTSHTSFCRIWPYVALNYEGTSVYARAGRSTSASSSRRSRTRCSGTSCPCSSFKCTRPRSMWQGPCSHWTSSCAPMVRTTHTHTHTHRPCALLILGGRGGVMQSSIFSCLRSRPPFCWSAA